MADTADDFAEQAANEYERARVKWVRRRYWHATRYCWVEGWVGEIVYGQGDGPEPERLLEIAQADFRPKRSKTWSALEGPVERFVQAQGRATALEIAQATGFGRATVLKYLHSRYDRFERAGYLKNQLYFRLNPAYCPEENADAEPVQGLLPVE